MLPIPTDLLLYDRPHYPSNAIWAEHFESRTKALSYARRLAALYATPLVAELFPSKAGAAFTSCEGSPYEIRRIRPRR